MNQTSVIAASLVAAYIVFITVRGELPAYFAIFTGPKPAVTGGTGTGGAGTTNTTGGNTTTGVDTSKPTGSNTGGPRGGTIIFGGGTSPEYGGGSVTIGGGRVTVNPYQNTKPEGWLGPYQPGPGGGPGGNPTVGGGGVRDPLGPWDFPSLLDN